MFQDFGKGRPSVSRCDLKQNLLNEGCNAAAVEFPSSTITIQKDTPLSDRASGATEDVTQIRPQKIHMTLRPGTSRICLIQLSHQCRNLQRLMELLCLLF